MNTQIFHSVNASLFFSDKQVNLLVDGIHGGAECGMSLMSGNTVKQMIQTEGIFSNLHLILFTHLHPDHYDQEQVERFIERSTNTNFFAPGLECGIFDYDDCKEHYYSINYRGIEISVIPTTHEGKAYRDEINCAYLLDFGRERFFIGGDALLGAREYRLLLKHDVKPIDIAFVNPCQVLCQQTRRVLEELNPNKVYIYHLPYEKDDVYQYRQLAMQAVRLCKNTKINIKIISCGQWIGGNEHDLY